MYKKTIWKDQKVERPKTYEFSENDDGSNALIEAFGEVEELGTPVNADNMNHIEEGIASCAIRQYVDTEEFEEGEWVLGVADGGKTIYESLIGENINNPLTDDTKWRKTIVDSYDLSTKTDKLQASSASMPNVAIILAMPANGSTVTAPSDGYYAMTGGVNGSGNRYIWLVNQTANFNAADISISGILNSMIFLPVSKGDVVRLNYSANTGLDFRFIPTNGSKESEVA